MAKTYKLRWRENGKHCQRTFKTKAEKIDFELYLRTRKEPQPSLRFGDFAERWFAEHQAFAKAPSTAKMEEAVIRRHLMPALENLLLRDLRKSTLYDLRGKWCLTPKVRGGKPLSVKTVNNLTALAKAMLSTAVDWDLLEKNPWLGVEALRVPERTFAYWTADERDRFLVAARHEPAFRDLVLVAAHTGLRKGELKALRREALNFDLGTIRVEATHSELLRKRLERTKSGKVDHVPMSALVSETLAKVRDLPAESIVFDQALFGDFNGRLERRCRQYGVRVLRPHDLRHTFASCLVMAGVDLYTVQKLMRHGSLAMTERYAHLAPNHLRSAVEAICAPNVRESWGGGGKVLKFR